MNKKLFFVSIVAGISLSLSVYAQTLAQREQIEKAEPKIADAVQVLNQNCGAHVTAKVDWASFAGQEWTPEHSPGYWCAGPLSDIQFECQTSAAFKSAIAANMTTYTCNMGTPGVETFSLQQGNFTYSIGWTSNIGEKAVAYLKQHL